MKTMLGERSSSDEDEGELAFAARTAFKQDPPNRTFTNLFPHAFNVGSPLRAAFRKWVEDEKAEKGVYSHIFNAGHDSLASALSRSHLIGINMNEALGDPELGPPVVAHISAAIKRAAESGGAGFSIFIDEAANLLGNEGFRDVAKEMFREYRKLDGIVGMAFQDPAALHRSGIADAILDNVATLIFFPNSMATRKNLAAFNLNDEQVAFITGEYDGGEKSSRGSRRVLVVQREASSGFNESAIIDIDLAPLGGPLRFYRAGNDANRHLAAMKQEWGDQWLQHL